MLQYISLHTRRAARGSRLLAACALIACATLLSHTFAPRTFAQAARDAAPHVNKQSTPATPAPAASAAGTITVREIDAAALAKLLPQQSGENRKPVLINFWATWCEPCRVEFPDLVKIDNEFRVRGLDFFTVSLDLPEEIATTVPTFLREMKSERIPAYLLNTPEPADAINAVDKTWSGALPATFLFNRQGQLVYKHFGLIKPAELKAAIEKTMDAER